jgi:DUF4097 and DUF4098 domain-containing protein YvlB
MRAFKEASMEDRIYKANAGTFLSGASYHSGMMTKLLLAGVALAAATSAFAQDSEHSWSKTYPVSGKPTLIFETGDAGVEIHSCAGCREIRIHVELEGKKLSDYRLEESQGGDQVQFRFRQREHMGFNITTHRSRVHVEVETPAQLTLQATTSDGSVELSNLEGEVGLTTGDGDVTLDHVSGNLRLKSGDGHVRISDAKGALEARTSDASLSVDGAFHALTLRTSDGTLDLNLHKGTQLTEASSIQSSDGSVTVHLPQGFAADLDVHTSDGHVDCALPLTMDHYHSNDGEKHELHGRLNGGGTPLTIHTSDGSVRIEQI